MVGGQIINSCKMLERPMIDLVAGNGKKKKIYIYLSISLFSPRDFSQSAWAQDGWRVGNPLQEFLATGSNYAHAFVAEMFPIPVAPKSLSWTFSLKWSWVGNVPGSWKTQTQIFFRGKLFKSRSQRKSTAKVPKCRDMSQEISKHRETSHCKKVENDEAQDWTHSLVQGLTLVPRTSLWELPRC